VRLAKTTGFDRETYARTR